MIFSLGESEVEMTTWFDPAGKRSLKADVVANVDASIDAAFPDEDSGETLEFKLSFDMEQSIVYRLLDAGSG